MAILQANYWLKNGSASWGNCQIDANDRLNIECVITDTSWDRSAHGDFWKAEFKFVGPGTDPAGYSIYTPLQQVFGTDTFTSPAFPIPLPSGTYTILWITIYDNHGLIVTAGKV